jgi:hypothetical protein
MVLAEAFRGSHSGEVGMEGEGEDGNGGNGGGKGGKNEDGGNGGNEGKNMGNGGNGGNGGKGGKGGLRWVVQDREVVVGMGLEVGLASFFPFFLSFLSFFWFCFFWSLGLFFVQCLLRIVPPLSFFLFLSFCRVIFSFPFPSFLFMVLQNGTEWNGS